MLCSDSLLVLTSLVVFQLQEGLRKGTAAWCAGEAGDGVLLAVVAGAGDSSHRR